MAYLEQTKYLEPKFSYSFDDLASLLKRNGGASDSTRMSRISAVDRLAPKSRDCRSMPTTPITSKK